MTHLRMSPSAAVTPTEAGVMIRSDLATFQVSGPDLPAFLDRVLPLLDGSKDREALAAALPGYSRASVLAFLDLLEARGLVEPVPEAPARLHGQETFLRLYPGAPADAATRIARARVTVVDGPRKNSAGTVSFSTVIDYNVPRLSGRSESSWL